MTAARRTASEWPKRIYYVCNSGSGIVVNATPLAHAGAGAVVGMRILCGVRDPARPTPAESREALLPAERLTTFARALRVHVDDPKYGPPDAYAAWSGVLDEAAKRAKQLDATLVYNVTGGPRAVPLASLLGASVGARASIMTIAVSFSDRACTQLVFNASGQLTAERTLPIAKRIGFDGLVSLYGYCETNPAGRRAHEKFIDDHRGVGNRVLGAIRRSRWGMSAIASLHRSMHGGSTVPTVPFEVDLSTLRTRSRTDLLKVVSAFDGLSGLVIVRRGKAIQRIKICDETAREFVGGKWLEAVIVRMVRDIFKGFAHVEVVAGATLAVEGRPPPTSNALPDDTELDVAIALDDQLHVIEVKAVQDSAGFGDYIAKLVKVRQELGSQVMQTFLVAPLVTKKRLARGAFVARAEKQGIHLLNGLRARGGALDLLDQSLGKLI